MKKVLLLLLAALLLLMGTGCEKKQPVTADWVPDEAQTLVVYTAHKEEVYTPIIREFEERTGIWVEVVTGGTNELLSRIADEAAAPQADVMFGGGVESLESYQSCFTPYTAQGSQHLKADLRSQGCYVPFSALPVVLIYNTKLVDPAIFTDWSDLLLSRFQGKIAFADPEVSGSSFTALVTWITARGGSQEEAFLALAKALDGQELSGSGDVLTAVADGSFLVGITLEETAMKWIAAGEDIGIVYPSQGTSVVPDGSALVAGAPHPDNAKAFLDFTLSPDVQNLLESQFYRRSVCQDVTQGTSLRPYADLTVLSYDVAWASENRDRLLSDWTYARKEAQE